MQRYEPCSLGLSPLHRCLLTHHGAARGVDWRSIGIERCSSDERVLPPRGKGFCIARPAISAPQSLVNKFTVLTIEDPNIIDSKLVDTLPPIPFLSAPLCKPRWEKRLSKLLSISALDTRGTSLLLPVEIGTMDMSELHSVEALLDCGATRSLIDRGFVCSKGMNTWTLSHNILVFNVDGSPNEAGQISEVVDVVLRYKTYSKRMLLAISRLGKQNLILGYNWLKDHNPKIDWKKEEVEMTYCPLCCEEGCVLQKEQTCQKRIELRALWSCHDGSIPLLQEVLEPEEKPPQTHHPSWELGD